MSKRKAKTAKKTDKKSVDEIIRFLPASERKRIKAMTLTLEFLNEEIEKSKKAMKLDASFGIPWLIAYFFCMYKFRYTTPTLIIFGIGVLYFCYAYFTRGSYGLNSKRVKVFEEIKETL